MDASLRMIENAIDAATRLGLSNVWGRSLGEADEFVACTADAAERLAKAIMGRHGLDAYGTHSPGKLADQARQADLESMAEDFLRMNGATREEHVARYKGATRDSLACAIARLPVVFDLMRTELADLSADFLDSEESAELVETAMEVFRDGTATLRAAVERDGADMQPPDPSGWLMPLAESREALAETLDATTNTLLECGKRPGNDD